MPGGVFVLKDAKTLVEMQPASFASEDDFQRLLAAFPSLLAGQQIDNAAPRKWLLVAREKSITDSEGGSGRWSLDHLFLDQDGIPTLVEVKRQTDSRIRREVVGQMLDYAANSAAYWSIEELRAQFEKRCVGEQIDPGEALANFLGPEADAGLYWQQVKTNLQAGRIRMLFVADLIPPELRKIVEFLNRQMDPAEVLALELRQYEGEGLRTLVPMVYGQTEEAQQKKAAGNGSKREWAEAEIFAELERRWGEPTVGVARKLAGWMRSSGGQVSLGQGSVIVKFEHAGDKLTPLYFSVNGRISLAFGYCVKPPFDDVAKRREWLNRLNAIEGIRLPEEAVDRYPSIQMTALADAKRLSAFLKVMDWFAEQTRQPTLS